MPASDKKYFEHGYAVIIGAGGDLPTTEMDAQAVADVLRNQDVCGYHKDNVNLLKGQEAGRDAILGALDWLAGKVAGDANATAIFYFSGHGVQSGGFHILPHGYDLEARASTCIARKELSDKLNAVGARRLLILMDCCHAGGQAELQSVPIVEKGLPEDVLAELGKGEGRLSLSSSGKNEQSYGTEGALSFFTECLIEALQGAGVHPDKQRGFAQVDNIYRWVTQQVPLRAAEHDLTQTPKAEFQKLDDFAIGWYAGGDYDPKHIPAGTVERIQKAVDKADEAEVASLLRYVDRSSHAQTVAAHEFKKGRPMVAILHGSEPQCPKEFMDRLHDDELSSLLAAGELGIGKLKRFAWPSTAGSDGDFQRMLRIQLLKVLEPKVPGRAAGEDSGGRLETLMRQLQQPTVLYTHVWDEPTPRWLHQVRLFLQQWGSLPQSSDHPVVVFLCFKPEHAPGGRWTWSWWYSTMTSSFLGACRAQYVGSLCTVDKSAAVDACIVPELGNVTAAHVSTWVEDHSEDWGQDASAMAEDVSKMPKSLTMRATQRLLKPLIKKYYKRRK